MPKQVPNVPVFKKSELFITLQITKTKYTEGPSRDIIQLEFLAFLDRNGSKTSKMPFQDHHRVLKRGQEMSATWERHNVPDDYLLNSGLKHLNDNPLKDPSCLRKTVMRITGKIYAKHDHTALRFFPTKEEGIALHTFIIGYAYSHLFLNYNIPIKKISIVADNPYSSKKPLYDGLM